MSIQPRIIGRKEEQAILQRLYDSYKSEFVILYGRRRVGKTFLVNQLFQSKFTFRVTALANTSPKQQLVNFQLAMSKLAPHMEDQAPPANWFDAFRTLSKLIDQQEEGRKVLFFDELPWFDSKGSDFLTALEHLWNSWANLRNDVLLV
ncbi:MAG: ATP-binding protein [Bacteroidota bacterium]